MDTKWLSYNELAAALGITVDSARRLANRNKHWPRQIGNDGKARIGVPADRLPDETAPDALQDVRHDVPTDDGKDAPTDIAPDALRTIAALEGHIETLRDQLAKAEAATERERERGDRLQTEALSSARDAFTAAMERDRLRQDLDAATSRFATESKNTRPWWRRIAG